MNEDQVLLKKIACCFIGIDYADLTQAEKKIVNLLIEKKWLNKIDGELTLNPPAISKGWISQ